MLFLRNRKGLMKSISFKLVTQEEKKEEGNDGVEAL